MSNIEEKPDLKAGHPPAQKVGGVRIPSHRHNSESEKGKEEAADGLNAALKVSTSPPKAVATNISGAIARGNADFPVEAIQKFHDKPLPTHDHRAASNRPTIIQQPRK